ncbi:putative transcription factor bZIP family [Helianthus annuus]|nr:putative transcription factor bZIP family [Helianthus annuus]
MSSIGTGVDTGQQFLMQHHKVVVAGGGGGGGGVMGKGHFENRGESAIADNSQQTDTSIDIDTESIKLFNILRRLAQNREAARKSRLRKKAYVQQLENSRLKLTQLEHELKRARQQVLGMFIAGGVSGDQSSLVGGNGALAFDLEYARWSDDHQRLINDVRSAVNTHLPHNELRLLVEAVMSHYDEKIPS